jgi:hypothetical protein
MRTPSEGQPCTSLSSSAGLRTVAEPAVPGVAARAQGEAQGAPLILPTTEPPSQQQIFLR